MSKTENNGTYLMQVWREFSEIMQLKASMEEFKLFRVLALCRILALACHAVPTHDHVWLTHMLL